MPAIISAIISLVSGVVGDLSEAQKDKLALELQENQNISDLLKAQTTIDAAEASTGKIIDDWRDVVGWVCASAFAWAYVVQPMVTYVIALTGHPVPPLPTLDLNTLMPILMGMLGLGGMKSWEKNDK